MKVASTVRRGGKGTPCYAESPALLYYIKRGKRLLGYDNNTFEGHHKHRHGNKTPIRFINLEHLFKRFIKEIWRMRGERK